MKLIGLFRVTILALPALLQAAESTSAVEIARLGSQLFHEGQYKQAQKLFEKAVKLDSTNALYREALGQTFQREAEQASFPFILTGKARANFVRALDLDPRNEQAIEALIELQQQPIGLCEGNLTEAGQLVDRLAQLNPEAAKRETVYLEDARREASEPGQRLLCAPVKVSRVVTDRVLPPASLKRAAAPSKQAEVAAARFTATSTPIGQ